MKVTAKTYWVWSEKAEKENPKYSRAGEMVWPHYKHQAPAKWLEDGLIIDSSEYVKDGQVDLFEML